MSVSEGGKEGGKSGSKEGSGGGASGARRARRPAGARAESGRKERGFDRPTRRVLSIPADEPTAALAALERAKAKESPLVVSRRVRQGRYVVAVGLKGRPILLLPAGLNADLDAETEGGAVWETRRWWAPRRDGKILITLTRISPRHGRATTYQHHGCRCEACRAANAAQQRAYRSRTRAPRPAREVVHGAACGKRGCHCELGRAAARERQRRSRARRRAAAASADAAAS